MHILGDMCRDVRGWFGGVRGVLGAVKDCRYSGPEGV